MTPSDTCKEHTVNQLCFEEQICIIAFALNRIKQFNTTCHGFSLEVYIPSQTEITMSVKGGKHQVFVGVRATQLLRIDGSLETEIFF